MSNFDQILRLATKKAKKLGDNYIKLLNLEKKEIKKQGAEQHWIDLVISKKKFKTNQNKLVLPFLLSLTKIDPMKEYIFIEDEDGAEMDAIKITTEDGNSITVSMDTLINTNRGYIKAFDIKNDDLIIG